MAAPTDVRVEANAQTEATVRWTYGGSNSIAVYRSTDGSSYSEITDGITRVASGTTTYTDVTLSPGIKYWYKLSDDNGSTFSSVVTVYSHACFSPAGDDGMLSLPRFDGEQQQADNLNELAERVEAVLGNSTPIECTVCPTDGSVVIDCSKSCTRWFIITDQDINSVSIQWCDDPIELNFYIPPNESHSIRGWQKGLGATGDEPAILGGTIGRTVSVGLDCSKAKEMWFNDPTVHLDVGGKGGDYLSRCGFSKEPPKSKPGLPRAQTSGKRPKAGTNPCTPGAHGQLVLVGSSENYSLGCSGPKKLILQACGGVPPYSWDFTGDINFVGSSIGKATVLPPTNSGSAVSGTAYIKHGGRCDTNGGVQQACPGFQFNVFSSSYGCNDQQTVACSSVGSFIGQNGNCSPIAVNLGSGSCSSVTPCSDGGNCTAGSCDARTAIMISNGCNPCGVQAGATVTVTDAVGTQTTIILRA